MVSVYNYFVKVVQNDGEKRGTTPRVGRLSEPNNPNLVPITIQSPSEFKGPAGENGKSLYWTPEDLYVASLAVCSMTTFVTIAENSNLIYHSLEIYASGRLERGEGAPEMFTEIEETFKLTLISEKDHSKALRVLEKVEENCLIAKSMKTKIVSKFEISFSS
jgi:uncharacterized OsmC-like protein